MAIPCIVIDDEPLAVQVITELIKKVPELHLQRSFYNPAEALAWLKDGNQTGLVFLDIQMPELTGIEFMQLLRDRADVILISAYDEYALDGFEHDAVDYLLKPVSFERFVKAVQKVINRKPTGPATEQTSIFIRTDKRIVRVDMKDILFIEALRNYVAIQTDAQKILTLQNLRSFEGMLPAAGFIRIHKSFIIAIDKISSVDKQRVFIGPHTLPVGDAYVKQFLEAIKMS